MADTGSSLILIGIFLFVFAIIVTIYVATSRYKLAPSDKILVVYGNVKDAGAAACYHGGGKIVWPLIQHYAYLDLKPMTIRIDLQHALSQQNIRINVPSTFTIGISTAPSIMQNAAERLLGLSQPQIEDMASEIIFGQLRLTVATLTIEQINQDREAFLSMVSSNVDSELHKIGLYLINVNITDITDEAEYIISIGAKAAAVAIAGANKDRAEAARAGAVGVAIADKDREIQVRDNQAESKMGQAAAEAKERVSVQQQERMAIEGVNISRADIAISNAQLAEKEAEARQRSEVAVRRAQEEIEKAQYTLESERLRAADIAREIVAKEQIEISAEAEAERQRRIAQGQADAILARYRAEAEGQQAVLEAKAAGYKSLVGSAGGDPKAAATLLMVEKVEELVARQTEAISNLKIDKITVWDSGNGNSDSGGSTSNFISSLMQSLPPVHDVAKMAGIELPEYLGAMKDKD
ncbi:MAG: flotillin [Euryarchaeota archaeon]|nr:flotillin [Euryarchaeota archaeon]